MANTRPARQIDWAAEWCKYKFNKNGDLIVPEHLEKTVRSTLTCQLFYSKDTPALQSAELFISSFMIELHNRLGKDPLVNWIYATPHYRQPGAAMTEYSVLKDAARDESLDAREIVALVVTNGESTGFPQAPPAEPTRDVADPNADTEDKTPHQTHVRSENDAKPQGAAAAHTKEVTCGNCHRPGHELRDCIGPVDAQGWLAGCPLCNSASHLYHECIRRKTLIPVLRAKNDQDFLLYYRQNKPPIKCTIDWTEVYNKRHPLLIALPWTPAFALQQSKVTGLQGQEGKGISWEAYEYEWVDNPDLEARHRMKDPAVDDLAKKTLAMFGVRWEPTDEF